MAETTVDSDIQIDGGALFRNIMDTPRGGTPTPPPSGEPQPDGGEPRAPVQRQDADDRQTERRDPPQLTEHQRQQVQQPDGERPTGERLRDPATGRFVPREGEQPDGQPAAPATGADAHPGAQGGAADGSPVPSWRLREERETREATQLLLREAQAANKQLMDMMQRMQQPPQQMQPPPQRELPDPVLDPRGYHAAVMEEVTSAIRVTQLDTDLRMTHARHGEKFEKAYEAFLAVAPQHPDFARSVVNGPSPGQRMVDWYERQTMMAEIGPDPQAWLQRQLQAALSDPENLRRAIDAANAANRNAGGQPAPRLAGGQQQPPGVTFRLPPTLSRLPSGSPDTGEPSVGGGENDSEHMFRTAMDRKRPGTR